jgi:two-component sensor histidine kinase
MMGRRPSNAKPIDHTLLFVQELSHRIRNEYTKAISFASTMAQRSPSPEAKAALSKMIDHLLASAEAHRLLVPRFGEEAVDFTEDVTRLCRTMASVDLDQRGIGLHLDISEPILMDGLRCWRANLILSELITNASRHAFDLSGGHIVVVIATARGQVLCRISDNGNSSDRTPKPGLGTQIIDALVEDLQGDVERRYGEQGAVVTLTFPLDPDSGEHRLDS